MRNFFILFVLILYSIAICASPAIRTPKTVVQSDGTELTIVIMGDEFLHYYSTLDGHPLVEEENGDYCYATISDEGLFVSTKTLAHNIGSRLANELSIIANNSFTKLSASIRKLANQRRQSRSINDISPMAKIGSTSIIGTIYVPVLLVEFQDEKFTHAKSVIEKNFNGINFTGLGGVGTGSVRDYFIAQSDGLFTPEFVVMDIVTMKNSMAYYGGNNFQENDYRPREMIVEACRALDSKVDFSKFDNDKNGEVEFIYCIYAGYSESAGGDKNTIWPHKWQLTTLLGSKGLQLDNVKLDKYACSSELAFNKSYESKIGRQLGGIGTICHEFSHCLGLPDLYDTMGKNIFGMDYWDLMDYGCYLADGYAPIGYSAYERDFMGWRSLETLDSRGDYSIASLTSGGVGYKIINEKNPNEYYILENRQNDGFDKHIHNSGMLIMHINYSKDIWDANTVNNDPLFPRHTLKPADGELLTYGKSTSKEMYLNNLKGDPWPGTSNNRELTDYSNPASTTYTGGYMGKPITNISEQNGIIYFSFLKDKLLQPTVNVATDITTNSFKANWEVVEDALCYNVELQKAYFVGEGQGDIDTLLVEDFAECSKSNILIENPDDYMLTTGWGCTNAWSETGVLRIGTNNNSGSLSTPAIITSSLEDVTVFFRAKRYNSGDSGIVLTVNLKNTGSDVIDGEDFILTDSWKQYAFIYTPQGNESYLTFTSENSSSQRFRVNLDDIYIVHHGLYTFLKEESYTSTTNYYLFNNLVANNYYRYRVQAVNAQESSPFSMYESVKLVTTGIDYINENESGQLIEIYSISGILMYKGLMDEESLSSLAPGSYIFREKNRVYKRIITR